MLLKVLQTAKTESTHRVQGTQAGDPPYMLLLECRKNTHRFHSGDAASWEGGLVSLPGLQKPEPESGGEGRLSLPEGTCVNSCGCQGGVIGIPFSKCLMQGAGGYAVAWIRKIQG
eukprot:1014308-Pelagomonas_calceolata.AAC.1